LKIYIVGKNEQYIGSELIEIKLTKQEAKDWCKEQQLKNEDLYTTYAYKEMELNLGKELTGIELFDLCYNKAKKWKNGPNPDVHDVYTQLYNYLFYDSILKITVVQEGTNINPDGAKRAQENYKKNLEQEYHG
jgi:hypothetical protein